MDRTFLLSLVAVSTTLTAALAPAQVEWLDRSPSPLPRQGHAMVYDVARQTTFLFGGRLEQELADTWQRSAAGWQRVATSVAPQARSFTALAHDARRGVTVLFGGGTGYSALLPPETWEWNGQQWEVHTTPQHPPPRRGHVMAFDAAHGKVLLFGGHDAAYTPLRDSWEYDGMDWRQLRPPHAPTPRSMAAATFDSTRGCVVLFGGATSLASPQWSDETWEWDGADWLLQTPSRRPAARSGAVLMHDPRRGENVLFGASANPDTWEWNGHEWRQRTTVHAPDVRDQAAMVYDAALGTGVLFGGGYYFGDTWEYDGVDWMPRTPPTPQPAGQAAMAFDERRGEMVLFGGYELRDPADTWEWNGARWARRVPAHVPPVRSRHGLAFDRARGVTVMFGGFANAPYLDDTWEWNGLDWTQRLPATRPPARQKALLAHDSTRQRTVLFGGNAGFMGEFDDTWEWDGNDWLRRSPAHHPPGSTYWAALMYDQARQRTLLLGYFPVLQVWEWDGTDWTSRAPLTSPPAPRYYVGAAHDERRGRTVVFGGIGQSTLESETWEWEGARWLGRTTTMRPLGRYDPALAYDSRRGRIVMYGGFAAGIHVGDTWELAAAHPASHVSFAPGCAGSAGTPSLAVAAGGWPWLGSALRLQLANLPAARIALLGVGCSRTQWQHVTLPFDLASIGMPACTLSCSLERLDPVLQSGGAAAWALPIPDEPPLLGVTFYQQALALDPLANSFGAVLSNACAATIGAR